MKPNFLVDQKTRKYVFIVGAAILVLFLLGVLIGYLSAGRKAPGACYLSKVVRSQCRSNPYSLKLKWKQYFIRYVKLIHVYTFLPL